ncbi:hypothetical protein [Candidatus Epulonipiscium viviparus]|uniref:hypothetical protein n=1 Tax=Candidatus Epulonipiscium viviparus TaxID=420336 RepID=UPI00030DF62F|nr:hypothetical protein [Candidatus Epulopiscium viviparus]
MKKFIASLIAVNALLGASIPTFAAAPAVATTPLGAPHTLIGVRPSKTQGGLPFVSLNNPLYKKDLDGILMAAKGTLPGGISMYVDADGKTVPADTMDLKGIPAGTLVTMKVQFSDGFYIKDGVGATNINIAIGNNPASNKNVNITQNVGTITFTDAAPLGANQVIKFQFIMPDSDLDLLNDFSYKFSVGDIVMPKGSATGFTTAFPIINITPGKTDTSASSFLIKSTVYAPALKGKLVNANGDLPSSMTVQLQANGKNITPASTIKAGDKITLKISMFTSYAIKGGVGTPKLEITLTSPKGLSITPSTNAYTFNGAQPVGASGKFVAFDFIMPEGTIDPLTDFVFSFAVK